MEVDQLFVHHTWMTVLRLEGNQAQQIMMYGRADHPIYRLRGFNELEQRLKPWSTDVGIPDVITGRFFTQLRGNSVRFTVFIKNSEGDWRAYLVKLENGPRLYLIFRGARTVEQFFVFNRIEDPLSRGLSGVNVKGSKPVFGKCFVSHDGTQLRAYTDKNNEVDVIDTFDHFKGIGHTLTAAQFKKLIGKNTTTLTQMPSKINITDEYRSFNNDLEGNGMIVHAFFYKATNTILFSDDDGNILSQYPYIPLPPENFNSVTASSQDFVSLQAAGTVEFDKFYPGHQADLVVVFDENGSGFEVFYNNFTVVKLRRV